MQGKKPLGELFARFDQVLDISGESVRMLQTYGEFKRRQSKGLKPAGQTALLTKLRTDKVTEFCQRTVDRSQKRYNCRNE